MSLALVAANVSTGCAVDAGTDEQLGTDESAVCQNLDGTNAMLASLATAIANDLGRWEITKDFEIFRGTYYQEQLRIRQSSRGLCRNGCKNTDALLALQDARKDQLFIFKDGSKLNSWTFAARLVAGYRSQQTCEARARNGDPNSCTTEAHYLEPVSSTPATCGGVDYGLSMNVYKTSKATSAGLKVDPEQRLAYPQQLKKKLLWAENGSTGTNPYLQFAALADGIHIEVDPAKGTTEEPIAPATCGSTQLKLSLTQDITNTCCSYNGSTNTVYKPYPALGNGWYKCQ